MVVFGQSKRSLETTSRFGAQKNSSGVYSGGDSEMDATRQSKLSFSNVEYHISGRSKSCGVKWNEAKTGCPAEGLNPVAHLQLLVDIGKMEVHSPLAYEQFICNLFA